MQKLGLKASRSNTFSDTGLAQQNDSFGQQWQRQNQQPSSNANDLYIDRRELINRIVSALLNERGDQSEHVDVSIDKL